MKKLLILLVLLISTLESSPKRILVGSPIRQKPAILNAFLESLDRQERNAYTLDFCFVDDNTDKASKKLLEAFSEQHRGNCHIIKAASLAENDRYLCDETTHYWNQSLMKKVAAFKDEIIRYCLDWSYDYVFFIDSDIVLHPFTIDQLLLADKEIVANIFWTKWQPNDPPLPQVWLQNDYSYIRREVGELLPQQEIARRYIHILQTLSQPGIVEVGGLGACTLIHRSALEKGVRFEEVKNLGFPGEDRHFCMRAAARNIPLYVDTHLPALHIYRESNLADVEPFKKRCGTRITLSMIVKNEADRYLREVLESVKPFISSAVIIDDASTDHSAQVCEEVLAGIDLKLIRNEDSLFSEEHRLRKQQWEATVATDPDWILNLDADEIFEERFISEVTKLVRSPYVDVYTFRLFDFWDSNHYREDSFWNAHLRYSPFLVRYNPAATYVWSEKNQHCGRFPLAIYNDPKLSPSDLRLKHYGWARQEDRVHKYERYKRLDPEGEYGILAQYESILDNNPRLIAWEE